MTSKQLTENVWIVEPQANVVSIASSVIALPISKSLSLVSARCICMFSVGSLSYTGSIVPPMEDTISTVIGHCEMWK